MPCGDPGEESSGPGAQWLLSSKLISSAPGPGGQNRSWAQDVALPGPIGRIMGWGRQDKQPRAPGPGPNHTNQRF